MKIERLVRLGAAGIVLGWTSFSLGAASVARFPSYRPGTNIRAATRPLATFSASDEFPLGTKLPEAALSDHGRAVTVRPNEAFVTAIIFVSTTCEVTEAYSERLKQLFADYNGKKVQFAFVDANASESFAEIDAYTKAHRWSFRVYKDESNHLADKLNAQVTPEVFLFDHGATLRYHGRVDDSRNPAKINTTDTRVALDAMLAGQPVRVAETKAFGCTISRTKEDK